MTDPHSLLNTSQEYKLFTAMTPTQHEKDEWSRLARAAYDAGRNDVGHHYSAASSLPRDARIRLAYFDALQEGYRAWLVFNKWPVL
jgi:hypothetical protein